MKVRFVVAALAVLVLVLAAVWWMTSAADVVSGDVGETGKGGVVSAPGANESAPAAEGSGSAGSSRDPAEGSVLEQKLRSLAGGLSAQTTVEGVKAILADLKEAVHAESPDQAARQLIALLESGIDRPTGLEFLVGPEGVMEETPTLRTALLDLLGQTDPFLSAEYARRVMATTNSADEYALALRNLAWTNTSGGLDAELRGHFAQMLGRMDWAGQPTDGFLEAFDVGVAVRAVDALATRITQPAAGEPGERQAEAAFIALDRIMLSDPSTVVAAFRADPAFLSGAPTHRASLLSRLDVRQPEQSRLLREYLLRPDVGAEEMDYFIGIFPNGNRVVGHRLVTADEGGGSAANMALIDHAALGTLGSWVNDPAMAARRSAVQAMITRLEDLTGVRSSSSGR